MPSSFAGSDRPSLRETHPRSRHGLRNEGRSCDNRMQGLGMGIIPLRLLWLDRCKFRLLREEQVGIGRGYMGEVGSEESPLGVEEG